MLPEVVGKSVKSSVDAPMTSMPVDDSIPEMFQEGDGALSNPNLQGQDASVSPKDKETTEMGSKDLDTPVPYMPEISKEKDALQTAITDPNPDTIQVAEPEPFFSIEANN
ncbi:hypothetical protein RHGRI_002066 [Rhododendron griersonianum]|uniref:Uncharacterized protein n=1 Tax=Rhododendron griersonianum TaxID=479676 RepID=A0AAV6LMD3_9ERIC|nr:hypothetical protein RHGRI_002066 [Rhododendron griersonianum]